MGPQQLEAYQASEGKHARNGRLFRGVWLDEDQHSCQQDPPAAVDHLEVVHAWACASSQTSDGFEGL